MGVVEEINVRLAPQVLSGPDYRLPYSPVLSHKVTQCPGQVFVNTLINSKGLGHLIQFNKKETTLAACTYTRRGSNVGYGPGDWDWTPSRCRYVIITFNDKHRLCVLRL